MRLKFAYLPIAGVCLAAVWAGAAARAQLTPPAFLHVSLQPPPHASAHKPFKVEVALHIDSPYHIQGHPAKTGYIATEVTVKPPTGVVLKGIAYPKPVTMKFQGESLPVYLKSANISILLVAARPGSYTVPVSVRYQGCNERSCYPPATMQAGAVVHVAR